MTDIKALYTDGGLLSGNPSDIGGMWAWCGVDTIDERPLVKGKLPGGVNVEQEIVAHESGIVLAKPHFPITNNVAEMMAAIKALEATPVGWSGILYSDSEVTLGRLFRRNALNGLPSNVVQRLMRVLQRMGDVKGILLQGHPTKQDLRDGFGKKRGYPVSKHNVWCDLECNRLAGEFRGARG